MTSDTHVHADDDRDSETTLQLLALLNAGLTNVTTLVAEYRDRQTQPPSLSIVAKPSISDGEAATMKLQWGGAGPFSKSAYLTRRLWLLKPAHLKVEIRRRGAPVAWGVRDRLRWWQWEMAGSAGAALATGEVADFIPALLDPPLLTPVRLLGWLRITALGSAARAGREVITASAVPRELSVAWHRQRHYELEFDAAHGTMLRFAEFDAEQCTHLTEATAVAYGRQLEPELFRPPASSGTSQAGRPIPKSSNGERNELIEGHALGPATVWLTGLPGSGKTTIARALERRLTSEGVRSCVLDGDEIREGLSSDLGMSRSDRAEQARRVAHVAALMAMAGSVAIVALVSPFAEDRANAKLIHARQAVPFVEVWVNTPREVCEERDPKGLFSRARAGQLLGLTGRDAPYQEPESADAVITEYDEPPEAAVRQILRLMSSYAQKVS